MSMPPSLFSVTLSLSAPLNVLPCHSQDFNEKTGTLFKPGVELRVRVCIQRFMPYNMLVLVLCCLHSSETNCALLLAWGLHSHV